MIHGKQLVFDTLNHKKVARPPWIPYAGVHAGKLIGANAKEVLLDEDKLLEALLQVNKTYKPDGQPVLFDLQIEAEALGCELMWAEKAPPSVISSPLAKKDEIPTKIPAKDDGRIPFVLDVMKKFKAEVGETTALYGLVTGPLTLASHLRGTQIYKDMRKNPEYAKKLFAYCTDVAIVMADYYIEAGMDVIAAVDPVISQISSKHFTSLLQEDYTRFFKHVRDQKAFSSFFVCGDATRNLEVMCQTKPDSIAVDDNVDIVAAKQISDQYNIVMGGNIPLTTVMLFGNQQDNMKYVVDMIDRIEEAGLSIKENFIVAPGCDMPYDVPVSNGIAVSQAVINPEECRKLVENYEKEDINIDDVVIPDYQHLERPLIEAFTLDSTQCAACTYMKAAALDAKEHFGDKIDFVEYMNTTPEGMRQAKAMHVTNLPSLYINGQLKYASIIPDQSEFFAEIEKLLK